MYRAGLKKRFFKSVNIISSFDRSQKIHRGPLVLVYHGVEETLVDTRVQTLHIPLKTFERQMKFLRKTGQVISMDDLCSCLSRNRPLDPSHILITFDDGYKNNRALAAPLLASLGFPFSVFVSTRNVDERRRFPIYRLRAAIHYAEKRNLSVQYLDRSFNLETDSQKRRALKLISKVLKTSPRRIVESILQDVSGLISESRWLEVDHRFSSEEPIGWDDIRQLMETGVVIGSHGHDHFIFNASQEPEEIESQLSTSKRLLEQMVGTCSYVAYPNGGKKDITPQALAAVKSNNYRLGFTAIKGVIRSGDNPYLLCRVFAPNDLDQFEFRVKNSYRYHSRYTRWARQLVEPET